MNRVGEKIASRQFIRSMTNRARPPIATASRTSGWIAARLVLAAVAINWSMAATGSVWSAIFAREARDRLNSA